MSALRVSFSVTTRELTRQLPAATLPATMFDRSADPASGPENEDESLDPDAGTMISRAHRSIAALRSRLVGLSTRGPSDDLAATELATMSVAGLSRRRLLMIAAALLVAWILFAFVQQVSEAAAITARADDMRTVNAQLEARVNAAELELIRIQDTTYVEQQARAYRLGEPNEIPFALAADPPSLGPDAPGSAETRVGAEASSATPLESWLSLLFGPIR